MSQGARSLSWSALATALLAVVLVLGLALRSAIDQHRQSALQQQLALVQQQSARLQAEVGELKRQVRHLIEAPQAREILSRAGLSLQPWRDGQTDAWLIELKGDIAPQHETAAGREDRQPHGGKGL